jgi:hypothetical protein
MRTGSYFRIFYTQKCKETLAVSKYRLLSRNKPVEMIWTGGYWAQLDEVNYKE